MLFGCKEKKMGGDPDMFDNIKVSFKLMLIVAVALAVS